MLKSFGRLFLATVATAATIITPLAGRAAEDATPPSAEGGVIISEIGWAGSGASSLDEWIELTNLSDEAVDVSGWTLAGAATGGGTLTIPDGNIIAPTNTFLISNYANDDAKSTLDALPNLVTSSISLSNSSLAVVLADRSGTVRDAAGDGSAPFQGRVGGGSDGGGYVAMVRIDPVSDGTLEESWTEATETGGFDVTATESGTPGTVERWFVAEESIEDEMDEGIEGVEEIEDVEVVEVIEELEEIVETEVITNGETEETTETIEEADVTYADEIVEDPVKPNPDIIANLEGEAIPEETASSAAAPLDDADLTEAEPEPAQESNPAPAAQYPVGTLVINEFVSDAEEEWIEIYNPYNNVIPLAGWTVRDGSGKFTGLPDQLLGRNQYALVRDPAGKLNNDGDTIDLVDPSGAVVDSVAYGTDEHVAPKKSTALARDADGEWRVTTTVTPGEANVVTEPEIVETGKENKKKQEPKTKDETTAMEETAEDEPAVWSGPTTLRISEIYPNADGNDLLEEFIELENTGTELLNLKGWTLADASGRAYRLTFSVTVKPKEFLTLARTETNLALNNTSDAVTLAAPDGTVVDAITYENPPNGSSFARVGTEWIWSRTPTPDEPNDVSNDAVSIVTTAKTASAVTSKPSVVATRTRVEGTVLVVPGVLGTQIFYVATETGGIQIYQYDASFPEMVEGDRIVATGTMTESRGEARLKVSKDDAIIMVGEDATPMPDDVTIADLTAEDHGRLVRVIGTVLVRSGKTVTLEHEGAQIAIRVADGTDIDLASFVRGKELHVTGILVATSEKLTLLPRSPDDIAEVAVEMSEAPAFANGEAALNGKDARDQRDRTTATMITAGVILLLAAYSARKHIPKLTYWYAKQRALRAASQAAH